MDDGRVGRPPRWDAWSRAGVVLHPLALLLGLLRLLLGLFVLLFRLLLGLLHLLLRGLLLLLLGLIVTVIGGQASPATQIRCCLGELQVDRPAGRQRRADGGVSQREHSDGPGPGEN